MTRACKPMARQFLSLDSDSTRPSHDSDSIRKKFRWLWVDPDSKGLLLGLDKNNSGTSLPSNDRELWFGNVHRLCENFQQLSLMLKPEKLLWSNKHSDCTYNESFREKKVFGVWQIYPYLIFAEQQNIEWEAQNKNNALSVPRLVNV